MTNVLFDSLLGTIRPERKFAQLDDGRHYTYQDVLDVSARIANFLVARGVEPGDRVAVQVPKSIEALMLYLATVRAGAIFLPLNTDYTASEITYFLEDAKPRVFVCDPANRDAYERLAAHNGITLETLGVWRNHETSAGTLADAALELPKSFQNVPRAEDDLAAILYTSGTTGRSKGAMLTHLNLASNAEVLVEHWRFTSDDVLLHALPIFHTHGLFVASNVALRSGASMIFLPGFKLDEIVAHLPQATVMMGVPTFYSRLLSSEKLSRDLVGHMRLFVSGSAPLSAEVHKEFEERTGHAILERYGMTETNMNTSNPYDGDRRAGTIGFPLPRVEIRIADQQTGRPVPTGEVGVIEVRGPNVFKGYWQMPEKTKAEFREDGFFISGDLGRIDADGYLSIVGRDKDLIISGGYNVYPAEVEGLLDAIDGVAESAVIGAPHADFGEGVTAVVARRAGAELTEEGIRETLSRQLARYKVPKRVIFVDVLPRNTMGKIQKNLLRETYSNIYSTQT